MPQRNLLQDIGGCCCDPPCNKLYIFKRFAKQNPYIILTGYERSGLCRTDYAESTRAIQKQTFFNSESFDDSLFRYDDIFDVKRRGVYSRVMTNVNCVDQDGNDMILNCRVFFTYSIQVTADIKRQLSRAPNGKYGTQYSGLYFMLFQNVLTRQYFCSYAVTCGYVASEIKLDEKFHGDRHRLSWNGGLPSNQLKRTLSTMNSLSSSINFGFPTLGNKPFLNSINNQDKLAIDEEESSTPIKSELEIEDQTKILADFIKEYAAASKAASKTASPMPENTETPPSVTLTNENEVEGVDEQPVEKKAKKDNKQRLDDLEKHLYKILGDVHAALATVQDIRSNLD